MGWRARVLRRALSSHVPFAEPLRRVKRNLVGYEPSASNLRGTIEAFDEMKAVIAQQGRSFAGANVLEIGSGWFPTIPILLALEGANRVTMTDIHRHMDAATFTATINFLRKEMPGNKNLQTISRVDDLAISYAAPFVVDGVPDQTLDFVISRTVLEHIPSNVISGLIASLRPKLSPGGMMVHVIDNSDHLEHHDKSISRLNFLTWSQRKHSFMNALMGGGENRLRHHEYLEVFRQAGLAVAFEKGIMDEPSRRAVPELALASPFDKMTPEELSILTSIYVLIPEAR